MLAWNPSALQLSDRSVSPLQQALSRKTRGSCSFFPHAYTTMFDVVFCSWLESLLKIRSLIRRGQNLNILQVENIKLFRRLDNFHWPSRRLLTPYLNLSTMVQILPLTCTNSSNLTVDKNQDF